MVSKSTGKMTPMMQQYFEAKERNPQTVLFFRMGDFYEMFHEDAVIASKVLGLTLTSRGKGEDKYPMAGVPYHAVDKYLEKMIEAGHRVAICDQLVDPATVKGIVPRDVTRVVTPGTLTEDSSLESFSPNFLAAAAVVKDRGGLAYVDVSTGEVFLEEVEATQILDALERIAPAESLVSEEAIQSESGVFAGIRTRRVGLVTEHPALDFKPENAVRILKQHYEVASLDGFGLREDDPAVAAAGPLMRYVNDTQRGRVRHLRAPRRLQSGDYLMLDRTTTRNLELVEPMLGGNRKATLFYTLNRTGTGAGGRLLRSWMLRPLSDLAEITLRQEAIGELMQEHGVRSDLAGLLKQVADIERILARVGCGRANARDLSALGRTLSLLPEVGDALHGVESERLCTLMTNLTGTETLAERLTSSLVESPPPGINEGGLFRAGVNAELDELREISTGGKEWIAQYQAQEAETTGIASLKVKFNKVFGYYVEVTKANLDQVPEHYTRKQTLVNAERFITPELKVYEEKVLGAEEKIVALEYELFLALREEVAAETEALQRIATALAEIDAFAALADLGVEGRYILPELDDSSDLSIVDGRHPVLEGMLPAGEFVANDLAMHQEDSRVLIITGPNMAGKSTYIRQCALLIILAQMGAPIPAAKARIGICDRVFTRVGAADDLSRGQSTFMVEMNEAANILNNATEKSFIVLDEVGRGTSTFDGVSLAWSLTEHIHNQLKARCVFATHYHELAELGIILSGAANLNVAVR
ncbi:MAG: DNA mismatch repair protein MutS, partial [Planctomycetota bacterium]